MPPEPLWAVNFAEIYMDGSIGGGRQVPIAGQISLGIEGEAAFTLATLLKVWDTGPSAWNFASSITLPYIWEEGHASLGVGPRAGRQANSKPVSDLFDLYFTPIVAGYHFSKTEHVALSFNVWAPTGNYDPSLLANSGLNNWTVRAAGRLHQAVAGARRRVRRGRRRAVTDYQNAPLFTLDLMGLKRFDNGAELWD